MKTAFITGSGIGIDQGMAFAFANAGYRVIVTDVLEKEGTEVAEQISAKGGFAEFHRLDMTSTADVNELIGNMEKKYGAIDAIIANTGIAHKVPLGEMTDQKWDHTFDVDLKGILHDI